MRNVFITGATGYVGSRLAPILVARGHSVRALVRIGSERRIPAGCVKVAGDALNPASFVDQVRPADTFIQLVGVAHPSPSKAEQFKTIDLASVRASVSVAATNGIRHFIYVSVAHPAPVMKTYIAARSEGEALIRVRGLKSTILRPWYILGPGHRWPVLLLPVYWLLERIPATRASARRLGLVTIGQMLDALVAAVENPAQGIRVLEVSDLRNTPPTNQQAA